MEQIKHWDSVAADYQRVFDGGINEYNRGLLRFFLGEGLLTPGCRVLDIGCGVGKYGAYFASLGCDVTLTDISPAMLAHTKANMAAFSTPWRTVEGDFYALGDADLTAGELFDLSVAMMSPAVRDLPGVVKMSRITRGWCFTANFILWRQPKRDEFYRRMGLDPVNGHDSDLEESAARLHKAVTDAGFTPRIKRVPYDWSDERTPQDAADYLLHRAGLDPVSAEQTARAQEIAAGLADENGIFVDSVCTDVVWIYWNTEG